jgi:hypothetical protein
MTKRTLTGPLLREAATYLAETEDYQGDRSPFTCHAVEAAGGDKADLWALLVEAGGAGGAGGARGAVNLMRSWLSEFDGTYEAYQLDRQAVRFMLLHFLAEMLESEAA